MAVDVTIAGTSTFSTNGYSVTEDVTPIDASSSAGGVGTFQVLTNELTGDKGLIGRTVTLSDGAQGVTEGEIITVAGDGTILTITGNSALGAFNATVNAQPYNGTLGGAFAYYLGLVGITTGFSVDSSITSRAVIFPGWTANAWDQIKQLAAGQQVEITLVSDAILMRPIRQNLAQTYRDVSSTWNVDNSSIAQTFNIFYYNATHLTAGLAYPVGGTNVGTTQTTIQNVGANQSVTVNLPLTPTNADGTGLGVSPFSLVQPVAVDMVAENPAVAASQYSIIDQGNLVYPAALWKANGGSVTASIAPDSNSINIVIVGPNDSDRGPFRLAAPTDSTDTNFYNTLNIVAAGTFYNKKLLSVPTGNSVQATATVAGPTIDSFAINTIGDAWSAMLSGIQSAIGPTQTISVQTTGINNLGQSGSFTFLSFAQFDAIYGGHAFSVADAQFGGKTFAVNDAYLFGLVASNFTNQAFGNVAGARVFNDYSFYRITTGTITESAVSYSATQDNTFNDWDDVFGGKTFSAWDNVWAGERFQQNSAQPLRAA